MEEVIGGANMDLKVLAIAKKYTDDTMKGTGAIQGKNCTITKIENDDVNRVSLVTFSWTENDGTVKTEVMSVPYGANGKDGVDGKDGTNGKDGEKGKDGEAGQDGLSIKDAEINDKKHLILTLSDDSTLDAGLIPEQTVDLSGYVQKETGKGLSANDYDNDSKSKVDAIPANPKYTDTVYDDTEVKADIEAGELEITELKMLGWTVPKECPIQNEVNGNQFIQKVGRIDLGSLSWTKYSVTQGTLFRSSIPNNMKVVGNYDVMQAYIDGYDVTSSNSRTNKSVSNTSSGLDVVDSTYADASDFKSAMQGKYLYYELETPITTQIDGNEVVEKINESLGDYYLTNKAKWNQGTINYSSGAIVASTTAIYSDEIPCKEGDLITTKNMDNSGSENIIVVYYNNSGFVSSERAKTSYTVPSNVTKFRVNYRKTGDVNTNARVYVNNAIDEVKADLGFFRTVTKDYEIEVNANSVASVNLDNSQKNNLFAVANIWYNGTDGFANVEPSTIYIRNVTDSKKTLKFKVIAFF